MKTIAITILTVSSIAFVSSCMYGKRGTGKVTTQTRSITPFHKISIKGVFPVVISQDGGPEWVKVEADENLQELITIENKGDELVIASDDNISIRRSKKLSVMVNVKSLYEIQNTSVGSITSSGPVKFDSLEINSESVGKLELQLEGKFLRANLNSVGVTDLSGRVREARINNQSVGALHAFDLKTDSVMIHNTAVGIAEVYADKAFYIRSSSVGNLYYKGPGQLKEIMSEGIGKVERAEKED
jgi:hypothetical protein